MELAACKLLSHSTSSAITAITGKWQHSMHPPHPYTIGLPP